MVYYAGDIHGSCGEIIRFCRKRRLQKTDIIVLLGDVGANYFGDERDRVVKRQLASVRPTFLCIQGNHEMRPETISTYQTKVWNGGVVWYEEEYPKLLFAKDGEIFIMDGTRHLVIGGAYSVDKYYRLRKGFRWWADEQPSKEVKAYVEEQLQNNVIDVILSHTCPHKYEPTEMFLPMIDQSTVDKSTELWLDQIEEIADYKAWFCGHWHVDKRIDRIHFMYRGIESSEQFGEAVYDGRGIK